MNRILPACLLMALSGIGLAQDPAGADLTLLEEVRTLARRTAEHRATAPIRDPEPLAVRADPDLIRIAAEIRARSLLPAARMAARGRAWSDLGTRRPDFPAGALSRVAADLAGVGLDREGNRILVHEERLTDEDFFSEQPDDPTIALLLATGVRPDEPVLVHNLMHLLQQRRSAGEFEPTTDRLLAQAAMDEGEANLVAVIYLFQAMGLQRQVLSLGYTPDQALDGALMPAALEGAPELDRKVLDFVYMDGFEAASFAFRRTGWAGLERRWGLVRSTHDILHVRNPPARTPSPDVTVPDLPETYREQDRDSIGELGVILLVSALTGKEDLGLQAGDGWAADTLVRLEPGTGAADPDSTGVTLWTSRWKNEVEAAQFLDLYRRGLERSGPVEGRVTTARQDGSVVQIRILPASLVEPERPEQPD